MIHLHVHTDGSSLDGACKISDLIDEAIAQGENAVGISDHGNMIKVFEFYKKCKEKGVKPIIGCEFYIGEPESKVTNHIMLIAKTNEGLKNLYKLSTKSYHNFYSKPRISYDMLLTHKNGLICMTACLGSEFADAFRRSKSEAEELILQYRSLFGEDFYLEIQPNGVPNQKPYNLFLQDMSYKHRIEPVVTCDMHYVKKEDYYTHDTMLCMQVNKKKQDKDRFRFTCNDFYMKTDEEIQYQLRGYLHENFINKALMSTHHIADKCNVEIKTGQNLLPNMPGIDNPKKKLAELCETGFKIRWAEGAYKGIEAKTVIERIKYELKVICDKGYAGYFLIVEDLMKWCRNNDIYTGVGRGSVGGSEIAFALRISEIEPIRYGLYFERFQNPERNSAPDIDSDFDYEKRDLVFKYITDKYGIENVSHILAEGTLACRAVVRKVLSAYDYEQKVINSICKLIPDELGIRLEDALSQSKELFDKLNGTDALRDMLKLEGLMSHTSMHAAGIVIAPSAIDDYVPCMVDRETGLMVSQWHKKIIEAIGLYKFDILALKLLTIYRKTLEFIKTNHEITITKSDLDNIDYNDEGVYNVLNSGDMCGIFQFDAPAGKKTVGDVVPHDFDDVMACESICRPGVKEAKLYVSNAKLYKSSGTYPVPTYYDKVAHVLDQTYGAIVYQEQTMLIFHDIGGYTLGEADSLRKVKSLEPERNRFCTNAVANHGFTKEEANELFDRFDLGYSFNKSHACAYGKNSNQGAWLKVRYPAEFMASCMTLEMTKGEPDLPSFIRECSKNNVTLLPPDINLSTNEFVPTLNGIRLPLTCLKGVGDSAVKCIMENRPYNSFNDFLEKVQKKTVKKNVVLALIKAGAFDCYNKNRSDLIKKYFEFRREQPPQINFWCDEVQIRYEQEIFGFSLGKHPLDGHVNKHISEFTEGTVINMVGIIKEVRKIKDKKGNDMAFVSLENKICNYTGIAFARTYSKINKMLFEHSRIQLVGKKQGDSLLIDSAWVI